MADTTKSNSCITVEGIMIALTFVYYLAFFFFTASAQDDKKKKIVPNMSANKFT